MRQGRFRSRTLGGWPRKSKRPFRNRSKTPSLRGFGGWGAELDNGRKFWWGDWTKTIGDAIAAVRFTGPCGGNGESNP